MELRIEFELLLLLLYICTHISVCVCVAVENYIEELVNFIRNLFFSNIK